LCRGEKPVNSYGAVDQLTYDVEIGKAAGCGLGPHLILGTTTSRNKSISMNLLIWTRSHELRIHYLSVTYCNIST
jgi:hypothetical protein